MASIYSVILDDFGHDVSFFLAEDSNGLPYHRNCPNGVASLSVPFDLSLKVTD